MTPVVLNRNLSSIEQPFDIIIVGGGITGVNVAREAAVRGIRALCLEKDDFGGATSAATSKLLHGGLRYLENFEFGLVRESLAERHILGLAAGHLSRPLPFLVPMYDWVKPGRMIMQAGLTIYDMLAYDRNLGTPPDKQMPGAKWISKEEMLRIEGRIEATGLLGGFLYYDYQSLHPERLTLAFVKSAVQHGATMINHARVTGFETRQSGGKKRVSAVNFTDEIAGKTYTARGTVIVNCSGPWMDFVLGLLEKIPEQKVQRSKGIHLLTESLLGDHAIFGRTKAGKHFLILPWQGMSLIGPTDSPYEDHPDDLRPLEEDVVQLMADVNEVLPGSPLTMDKIKHVPIGIRPLVSSTKTTYRASRKYEIYDHAQGRDKWEGIVSVVGGKWTTSRKLGEDVIYHLLPKLKSLDSAIERRIKDARTDQMELYGFPSYGASTTDLWEQIALSNHRFPDTVLNHLFTLYGMEYATIMEMGRQDKELLKRISDEQGRYDIMAQVVFAIESESAFTLSDVLKRRLAIGQFGYPGDAITKKVADVCGKMLKWSLSKKSAEIEAFKESYPLSILRQKKK